MAKPIQYCKVKINKFILKIFYSYKKGHRNKINLREKEIVILRLYDGLLRKQKRQKRIIE